MNSGCMSSAAMGCVDSRVPVRATYVNLYKWPESDAEFVKSVSTAGGGSGEQRQWPHPRVVDSYSCRQMYLRSYTFSKKESVPERTRKCLGRVKERVTDAVKVPGCVPWGGDRAGVGDGNSSVGMVAGGGRVGKKKKRCRMMKRLREASSATLCSIFRRLLSCTTTVDVAGRQPS